MRHLSWLWVLLAFPMRRGMYYCVSASNDTSRRIFCLESESNCVEQRIHCLSSPNYYFVASKKIIRLVWSYQIETAMILEKQYGSIFRYNPRHDPAQFSWLAVASYFALYLKSMDTYWLTKNFSTIRFLDAYTPPRITDKNSRIRYGDSLFPLSLRLFLSLPLSLSHSLPYSLCI